MKENTYANIAQKASLSSNTTNNNNQLDKYRAPTEKLVQLEQNDQLKFQEELKKLHSTEICQTQT